MFKKICMVASFIASCTTTSEKAPAALKTPTCSEAQEKFTSRPNYMYQTMSLEPMAYRMIVAVDAGGGAEALIIISKYAKPNTAEVLQKEEGFVVVGSCTLDGQVLPMMFVSDRIMRQKQNMTPM